MVLDFIRGDPVQEGYDQRMATLEAREDRQRRIDQEDEQTARDRAMERAYHDGLRNLYSRQQSGPSPGSPVTPAAPQPAAPPASPPAAPAPSAGGSPTAAAGAANLRSVTAGGGTDPIMQQLLQDPRLAREALARHAELEAQRQEQEAREDEIEMKAMDALAAGDLTTFNYLAQQTGLQVDPAILADATARANLARGANLAQMFFKGDPEQAGVFINAMMQTGGDVQASLQASGMPRAAPELQLQDILVGDQRVMAKIDMLTGVATPLRTPEGQMVGAPMPAGRGSGIPAQAQLVEYLRHTMRDAQGNPITPEMAWQLAQQAKANPTQAARQIYSKVYTETFGDHAQKDAQARQAVQSFLAFMEQENPSAQLYSGAPQPAPQGAQAPAQGGAAPPPPSGSYYDPQTRTVIPR